MDGFKPSIKTLEIMGQDKIDKMINEAKNERSKLQNETMELHTKLRIREAEKSMMNSFIDMLNKLKEETE